MPTAAPCGLRIAHPPHEQADGSGMCPGKPWPAHHKPQHRGTYQPEPRWLEEHGDGRHRGAGEAHIAAEPPPSRPHLRLGWHDQGDVQMTADALPVWLPVVQPAALVAPLATSLIAVYAVLLPLLASLAAICALTDG